VARSNPIIKSLTRPLTVKGCAYELFVPIMIVSIGELIAAFILGHSFLGFIGGIVTFILLFKTGQRVTAYDPQLIEIVLCRFKNHQVLDPKRFRKRSIEIL
jgi:type IV secretory pathway VirB3-like protein